MSTRHDRMGHHGSRRFAGRRRQPEGRKARRLRIESLEERQLLANADATGGVLRYTAEAGEKNEVVLSPGHFFTIQDADDVAQFGLGGCVPSDYLAGMSIGISASTGILTLGHFAVDVGVDYSFPLFIDTALPDGVICPTPAGLTSSDSSFADALKNGLASATKGSSPAVAGATVEEAGSYYLKVGAPSGPLDEYRLFQAVVDPALAIDEIPGNSSFLASTQITAGTLVNGTFADASGDDKDKDFYSFTAVAGEELAVIVDNKYDNGQTSDGDDKLANTKLTLYDSDGNELASAVGFDTATAVAGIEAKATGTYYVSIEDGGVGNGDDYRFVVIRSSSSVTANSEKVLAYENTTQTTVSANGSIVSSLGVSTGDAFTRITSSPTNIEVTVNLTFPSDGSLQLSLESPNGTIIDLVETGVASGANFTGTTFSDSASTKVGDLGTSAPYTGTYAPAQALSSLAGESTNGTWKLHVTNSSGVTGTLDNWSLKFTLNTDETAETANLLGATQYGVGDYGASGDDAALGSSEDVDYWKVTGATQRWLIFAVADTTDHDGDNIDQQKASLEVYGNDGATLLPGGTGVDTGPAPSGESYDDFLDQLSNAGIDLDQLDSNPNSIIVDLKDGNDSCDASKVDLQGSSITIHGGAGNDTILLPGGDNVTITGDAGNDTFVINPDYSAIGSIDGGTGTNTIVVNGTSGNDEITIKLHGSYLEIDVNDVTSLYQVSNIQSLSIDGGGGDDVVTIDSSGGALGFADGIGVTVEGSASQIIFTSGAKTAESDVIQVGPYSSNGISTITIDGVTQSVEFNAVNPVLGTLIYDDVSGPLEIVATSAANTVTLDQGPDAGTSLLTVDDLLAVVFSGKSELIVDAGAGNDVVDLLAGGGEGLKGSGASVTVNGGAGGDRITAEPGLEDAVAITLNGGAGNDILIGATGDNTYDGGAGYDTILIQGTISNDAISLEQSDASTLKHSITTAGVTASGTDSFSSIEMIEVDGGSGDDTVEITVADALVLTPADSVPFTVDGGAPNASDRLVVVDDGNGDLTILREGADLRSGSITVGTLAPIVYSGIENVDFTPVNSTGDGYGSDGKGRLLVIPTDPLEANDSRRTAADLEDLLDSQVPASIDPVASSGLTQNSSADEDWYKYTATKTGTFCFQLDYQTIGTLANGRAGLPGDGELKITVYDSSGNAIAKILGEGDSSHTIGVEAGKTYYVRVQGATADAINVYDIDLVDVDIYGPRVTDVWITGSDDYNLFTQKEADAGLTPTPLVYSISISIEDAVLRRPDYLYPALNETVVENPGHYLLVGDANGVIAIASVEVVNDPVVAGSTATATILLYFSSPLPDDRYTLTIDDGVTDPAGNGLDGETNTLEPQSDPKFPSGDGVAGGDFAARFTVDSRPEIGVWTAGSIYVDINGNFHYDTTNTDATNRDYAYSLGYTSDAIFAGKFVASDKTADGFDKLGVYGKVGKTFRWLIDFNSDGVTDFMTTDPAGIIGTPVAGDFDGNPDNGDEVGLFDGKTWYLDVSHDYQVRNSTLDLRITDGLTGTPIVGDFDGDHKVDLATYKAGKFYFDFAYNGYGKLDLTMDVSYLYYAGARLKPVAADMDMDGITDIGLWCPDRAGADSTKLGEWYILVSNDPTGTLRKNGVVKALDHQFSLLSPSKDIFARMGSEYAVPLIGNFDPPVTDDQGNTVVSTDSVIVSLVGTSRSERFSIAPGAVAGTWTITLDGKSQTIQAESLDLSVGGGGGRDSITLTATAGDDKIECSPGSATVVGDGYTMSVQGVATITIDAGGGDNSATLHGSSGNDKLTASAAVASLSGSGYSLKVLGAGSVVVDGGSGGSDSATLTGTAGNDAFFASLTSASLSGDGYAINLSGFQTVRAKAGSGGLDTATLIGSAGNDKFTATAKSSKLSGTKFLFEATGFDVLSVDGGGGEDTASISSGALKGSMSSDLIGTLPDSYRVAAWLSHFTKIQHNKKTQSSAAADEVFGAFWK